MNGGEDRAAPGLIQNRRRPGWQVRLHALLEVEGKLGVRQQVGIPVARSWRSPGDVQMPLDIVEPYLYATGLSGMLPPGGDVDKVVVFQGVLHLLVHTQSPLEMTSL